MVTVTKPAWWDEFADAYNFSDSSGSTADSSEIIAKLTTHLVPDAAKFRSHMLAAQGNAQSTTSKIDLLFLGSGHDFVAANGGSDYIAGREGDDVLYGEAGADILRGGAGRDLLVGDGNSDTASYSDATSAVKVNLTNGIGFTENDGQGGYDLLLKLGNVIGSDFSDTIISDNSSANTLVGGRGNDRIEGGSGNDVLFGGEGNDALYGEGSNDIFITGWGQDTVSTGSGADRIVIDASALDNPAGNRTIVTDFQTGSGGDKLDLTALLHKAGYGGSDAVGDGYIKLVASGSNINVMFDQDGSGGGAAQHVATLNNASGFSNSANLVTQVKSILYVPVLGQSNAKGLSTVGGDGESGITRLVEGLENKTDFDRVVSVQRDSTGQPFDFAVGGTTVDGNRNTSYVPNDVWWYPDDNKPGDVLLRAVDLISLQLAQLRTEGAVTPVIIWGQGEAEARLLGKATNTSAAIARYKEATLEVFDYIKDRLGDDIEFFIMKTGRFNDDAARNAGESSRQIQEAIKGVDMVRAGQQEIADARSDVHIGADYRDLPMLYDVDPQEYPEDVWHIDYDAREIVGDRLASSIADHLDDGGTNPPPPPPPPPGDIVGTDGDDRLVADSGGSVIIGGKGKDTIICGPGDDVVVLEPDLSKIALNADYIDKFKTGAGGDKIDISGLLDAAGYTGTNPVADGYLILEDDGTRTKLRFDPDGPGGGKSGQYLAKLNGVEPGDFSVTDNLIINNQQALRTMAMEDVLEKEDNTLAAVPEGDAPQPQAATVAESRGFTSFPEETRLITEV